MLESALAGAVVVESAGGVTVVGGDTLGLAETEGDVTADGGADDADGGDGLAVVGPDGT